MLETTKRTSVIALLLLSHIPWSDALAGLPFPKPVFSVGERPHSVTIGDFNGDGRQDIATANFSSDNVSVLLGNGDGTFGPETSFGTGFSPTAITTGNFGRGGEEGLDLVVANFFSDDVSVLLGNGDGTFGPETRFPVGGGPQSVTVGDFDGDGIRDLAVANFDTNDVSVLLGNDDGTFGLESRFPVGTGPHFVAVGDFNEDGIRDLVTASFLLDDISVLLGNGDGTFGLESRFVVGMGPISIAIGDLDGDGRQDLAVANRDSNDVSVLLGNGDGTFGPETRVGTGGRPRSIAVGDLNGDGQSDLATANSLSDDVSILLGNGDGTFDAERRFSVGKIPRSIMIGDVDRDGHQDLVVANQMGNIVSVVLGNGDGTFPDMVPFGVGDGPVSIAVEDFNGDAHLDLAVANVASNDVSVLLGNGDGTFAAEARYGVGNGPASIAAGDVNNDGVLDLVTGNVTSLDVSTLLGNGDGTFGVEIRSTLGSNPREVAIADFHRRFGLGSRADGLPDVAASYGVGVLLGNGAGGFALDTVHPTGGGNIVAHDFNADGKPDLAVTDGGGPSVRVRLADTIGGFGGFTDYPVVSTSDLEIADINGDNTADLLVCSGVLLGNGDGTFAPELPTGMAGGSVTSGDFDGDGLPDAATTFDSLVSVVLGKGDGTFGPPTRFGPLGVKARSVDTADFDEDGQMDLVTASPDTDEVIVLFKQGPAPPIVSFSADKESLSWQAVHSAVSFNVYRGALADLVDSDGDGLPDGGYGDCQNPRDPDTTDTLFEDRDTPAPGAGFQYLVSFVRGDGEEVGLGSTGGGLQREVTTTCP